MKKVYRGAFGPSLTDWLLEKDRPKRNAKSFEYLALIHRPIAQTSTNLMLLYFLMVECGMESCRAMFYSCKKQKKLLIGLNNEMKQYGISDEWDNVFNKMVPGFEERTTYIFKIIKENIYLSKYYPFFEANGYEILENKYYDNVEDYEAFKTSLKGLKEKIEKWSAENADIIQAHLITIAPLVEKYNSTLKKEKEKEKETKKEKTQELAEEKQLEKERKENKRKEDIRKRQSERYYSTLYKHDQEKKDAWKKGYKQIVDGPSTRWIKA